MLGDRQRFAGERSLGGVERSGFEQARIRAHGVARREQEHVARYQFAGGDLLLLSIALHVDLQRGELSERIHRALSATFLQRADDRIDEDDDEDDRGVLPFAKREGEHGREKQQVDEWALELRDKDPPDRLAPRLGEGVRAKLPEPRLRLRAG